MDDDALVLWWETHNVIAEVMARLPEGDLEEDLRFVGLDAEKYL